MTEQLNVVSESEVVEKVVSDEQAQPKKIETLEDAARYAYGVAETKKEIEKIQKVAQAELARWQEQIDSVNRWSEDAIRPLEDKLSYLTMLLTNYHIDQFYGAENDKAQAKLKSIKLPYGITLASKEQATKIEVIDESALLEYAKANNFTDTPAPKAKWGEIKKTLKVSEEGQVVDANGEVVTFVKAEAQDRKFEVK